MIENNNPEINVDEIMAKIRQEIAARRPQSDTADSTRFEYGYGISDSNVASLLVAAQKQANIAGRPLQMTQFPKYLRWLARLGGKIFLYLGKVITIPQTAYNRQVVLALKQMYQQLEEIHTKIDEIETKATAIKPWLSSFESRLDTMLKQAEIKPIDLSEAQNRDSTVETRMPSMDLLYSDFEAVFRGTREDIKKRAVQYLDVVKDANAGTESHPILDIGFGRGEWLELLQENNLHGLGLDINQLSVEQGRQRGHTVHQADALEYLRSAPDDFFGAITAFHIIEHFDIRYFILLLQQALRVLMPGGVIIFETPNPKNLIVGACNFWADPTHLRPFFPETQKFLLENVGFANVNLVFLNPHEAASKLPAAEAPQLAEKLNELLSCARDYAVTGYKT